jgi:rRNA maturation protein Nop10
MKKREFNAALRKCQAKGRLSLSKLAALPEDCRRDMANYVVRNRGPLLAELAALLDSAWLRTMGYLYRTCDERSGYTFVHTCEHKIGGDR